MVELQILYIGLETIAGTAIRKKYFFSGTLCRLRNHDSDIMPKYKIKIVYINNSS